MGKIIPKGWLNLKAFNETIDVFLPFKVPIREEHQLEFNEESKFTWPIFKEGLKSRNLKLVAIIDLIPHSQHYTVEEMNGAMGFIPYYKIGCKGGHVLPTENAFERFFGTVKHILDTRPSWRENEFIGVHCAKGVNRTGFMICKYLITCKKYDPVLALKMFMLKRECNFKREKYIEHLMQLCPVKHEEDGDNDDEVNNDVENRTSTMPPPCANVLPDSDSFNYKCISSMAECKIGRSYSLDSTSESSGKDEETFLVQKKKSSSPEHCLEDNAGL